MGRLMFLLVAVGFGWWIYDGWFAAEGRAAAPEGVHGADRFEDLGEAPVLQVGGPVREEVEATASGGDAIDRFVEALRAGDARVRARAIVAHAKASGVARERLEAAIREAIDAGTPADAVELLGDSNAFLHTEFGRVCAGLAAARVRELPPEGALAASTRILEAAMRGPIAQTDAAAKAAVDALYDGHQGHVRRFAFDPANAARARQCVVEPGDSLERIARRFRSPTLNLEAGTLALINRIDDPSRVQAGQVLRVPVDPVHCVADKSSFLLAVYLGEAIVRLYWMAHGADRHDTPETDFVVLDKIPNPDWHFEGRVIPFGHPENPLGRFFVKFEHTSYTGFGVHGTNEPETIGTRASRGCIRLLPDDIREFAGFVPRGATVRVQA